MMKPRILSLAMLTALCVVEPDLSADSRALPNAAKPGEAAMIGVFYDLKQTPTHQLTWIDSPGYFKVIDEYLSHNWDEAVLDRYYQVSKPLYTTQIYIPMKRSELAPLDFGVGPYVKPCLWLVHYKAQVSPPEDGTYRFVGLGDDIMAVAVNGKTVLAAPLHDPESKTLPLTHWKSTEPGGMEASGGTFWNGDWIDLKKDELADLDVIFGDCPGGLYSAYLMVERKGGTYRMDRRNHPILPIFQVAPYDTPVPPVPPPPLSGMRPPPFATGYAPWRCYQ